jgi:deazaflavin-dependent oxidoreductase (nitroreductase family)
MTTRRRWNKYRVVTTLERASNRGIRLLLRRGLAPRAFALLETTGRRSGHPRHTPVGNGLTRSAGSTGGTGDVFWLIAAHGYQADYVRNLAADPRVRVKIGRRWRAGTAVILPDDDVVARAKAHPHRLDAALGRLIASTPLTVRIDLDPP